MQYARQSEFSFADIKLVGLRVRGCRIALCIAQWFQLRCLQIPSRLACCHQAHAESRERSDLFSNDKPLPQSAMKQELRVKYVESVVRQFLQVRVEFTFERRGGMQFLYSLTDQWSLTWNERTLNSYRFQKETKALLLAERMAFKLQLHINANDKCTAWPYNQLGV